MRSFFPFLSNVHSNVTSMSILGCGIEFHPVSPLRSNATPLFVVAGLNPPPKKIHLRFDDFPSKSQGNWRVVHLSAAERRSGRFYQKGNIFSFVRSRPFLWCCFLCCGKIFINTTARPEGYRFAVGAAAAAAHVSSYEPPMSQSLGSAFSYLISLGNYFLCLPVCLALFLQAKTPPLSSLNRPTENWKNVSTLCPSFVPQNFFHFDRKKLNKISLTTIGGWCGWNKWPLR